MKISNNKYKTEKHFKLYNRHVSDLKLDPKNAKQLVGSSPLGNGKMYIDLKTGGFVCLATRMCGTYFELQEKLYPLMTYPGIKDAQSLESMDLEYPGNDLLLDTNVLQKNLKTFRSKIPRFDLLNRFGIDPSLIINTNFWMADEHRFCFMYTSLIGQPVCYYSWIINEKGSKTYDSNIPKLDDVVLGAPRIKQSNSKRIYFAEDPLKAIVLRSIHQKPVYVRPTARMFELNNYQDLIDGKEVICLKQNNPSEYNITDLVEIKLPSNSAYELLDIYDQGKSANIQLDPEIEKLNEELHFEIHRYRKSVKKHMKKLLNSGKL